MIVRRLLNEILTLQMSYLVCVTSEERHLPGADKTFSGYGANNGKQIFKILS